MVDIESRTTWGAEHGTGSRDPGPEPRVVIHHSFRPALEADATPEQERSAVRGIERFHVENNGWAGIGYNFLVAPSGRIYEGRGWKFRGAHAGPVNGESIGVCLLIDGQETEPTAAMIGAVRSLIRLGVEQDEISADYVVSGHRDHMERTCPGDLVYERLQEFRHDATAEVPEPPGPRQPPEPPQPSEPPQVPEPEPPPQPPQPPRPADPSPQPEVPEPEIALVDSLNRLPGPLEELEPVEVLNAPVRALVAANAGSDESTRDFLARVLGRVLGSE